MSATGKCVIFSAPSGAGKTTIVHHLLDAGLDLSFSVSATSRERRANEVDGRDYLFLSPDEFRQRIEAGDFVEWEEVYPGQFYGTLRSEVERIWAAGHHAIFDVDVVGGLRLKQEFGDRALAVFVRPPDAHARNAVEGAEHGDPGKPATPVGQGGTRDAVRAPLRCGGGQQRPGPGL